MGRLDLESEPLVQVRENRRICLLISRTPTSLFYFVFCSRSVFHGNLDHLQTHLLFHLLLQRDDGVPVVSCKANLRFLKVASLKQHALATLQLKRSYPHVIYGRPVPVSFVTLHCQTRWNSLTLALFLAQKVG